MNKSNEQLISEAAAKVKDFASLETAAFEAARSVGVVAPKPLEKGFASDLKEALLAKAEQLGLNSVAAAALIDDGLNKGGPLYALDQAENAVAVANDDAVRAIERNATTEQLAASAYSLRAKRKLGLDEIDKPRLLSALSKSKYYSGGGDDTRRNRNALEAALAAADEPDKSAEIEGEGNQPLDHIRRAIAAVARPESTFISVEDFERLMFRAETLEREGRVLLQVEIADETAILAQIEAIKKTPTLTQLRESTLKVAVPFMSTVLHGGWNNKGDVVRVGGGKVCVEIFERLATALAEATATTYTAPARLEPFVSAETAEAEAQAEAERKAEREARIAAEKAALAESEAKKRGGPRIRLNEASTGLSIAD